MGISSIGQYQRWNSNYSLIGRMTSTGRNQSILGNSPGYNSNPVTAVSKTQRVPGSLSSESLSFVQEYQRDMSGLMAAANKLKSDSSGSVTRDMQVTSSDTKVAEASAAWTPAQTGSYTLNVQQVATSQVNISDAVDAAATNLAGELTIQTGTGVQTFQTAEGSKNNADTLSALAKEINKADMGVSASVSLKDGKASLSLVSSKTGESSAFKVSGSLADTANLANPYAEAQNAVYTVKSSGSYAAEKKVTSETNSVYVDGNFRIKAQLKGEGKTTIGVAPDTSKTADAVQNLVKNFNNTLTLLNDNADRGVGVLNQMKRMLMMPTSEQSMSKIGITSNKDGTLSFDKATFAKASSESPSMVKDILSGSYGVANGYYNTAQRGLNISSNSLLSEDMRTAKLEAAYSPMNYATYTRNGAYNSYSAMNVLMNLMV